MSKTSVKIYEEYAKIIAAKLKVPEGQISIEISGDLGNSDSREPTVFYIYNFARRRSLVSRFSLVQLPGCCGILVSTGAEVFNEYRNLGIGTVLSLMRTELAIAAGYSLLLCTDLVDNEFQRKILTKNGWKDIYKFTNQKTGNDIYLSILDL